MEVGALAAGKIHQIDENCRTEASIDDDAFAVETVYEVDEILRGADVGLFDEAVVAHQRKLAERRIEEMSCDVADFPGGSEGLQIPFLGAEIAQKLDEFGVDAAEEGCAEDWFGAGDDRVHEMKLRYLSAGE